MGISCTVTKNKIIQGSRERLREKSRPNNFRACTFSEPTFIGVDVVFYLFVDEMKLYYHMFIIPSKNFECFLLLNGFFVLCEHKGKVNLTPNHKPVAVMHANIL